MTIKKLMSLALLAFTNMTSFGQFAHAENACHDLFRKEKLFSSSVTISETGRIDINVASSLYATGRVINSAVRSLYGPLSLKKIESITQKLAADQRSNVPYWQKFSDAFGLEVHLDPRALEMIPKTGPLIIAANHSQNGIEAPAMAAAISKVRSDVKIALTPILRPIPGLTENSIFFNPYGGEKATRENVNALEQAAAHLRDGHVLIIFPTGTVSGKTKWSDQEAVDGRWRKGLAYLVREVPQTFVLPIFVEGQPTQTFLNMTLMADRYLAKFPNFRTGIGAVFHIREVAQRIGQDIGLTVGPAIEGKEILSWGNLQQMMNHLKRITYDLKANRETKTNLKLVDSQPVKRTLAPIAEAGDRRAIKIELDSNAKVIFDMAPESPEKRMKVYIARGSEIPLVLNEIGRLREITFRGVGEGSGRERDLDRYDSDYLHLIAVDKKTGDIAGGYRMGQVDKLLEQHGLDGLYTSAFFDHSKLIKAKLQVSLELGRSFVVPEYQRSFALLALFGAIGQYVVANPQYKFLMGPVSISNEVSERSKGLIIGYLKKYYESPDAHLVTPLMPLKKDFILSDEDQKILDEKPDIRKLSELVEKIEKEAGTGNTLPPLIPIYIRLGATFFKFNIDAEFNTLDGLIVTDLSKLTIEDLKPYMGETGAASFLSYHASAAASLDSSGSP